MTRRILRYFRKRIFISCKIIGVNKVLRSSFGFFLRGTRNVRIIAPFLSKFPSYYLVFSQLLRQLGDSCGALEILLEGMKVHKDNDQLYFRISQIYRENFDIAEAHRFLGLAAQKQPGTHTISKLCFESEHGLFEEGRKSLVEVLNLPFETIRSQMSSIDRISQYYPEYLGELNLVRSKIKKTILSHSYKNPHEISNAVAELIALRQLDSAQELANKHRSKLTPIIQSRLNRIMDCFGGNIELLNCAWENEILAVPICFIKENNTTIDQIDPKSFSVVELFLPPAIFDYPIREKQTHETIRETFFNLIKILLNEKNTAIVPRMQLNWRDCFEKLEFSYVLSYHTSADFKSRRLHIQESSFAGYCSFDHSGFAGFSNISRDHSEITTFVRDVSHDDLERNQAAIYEKYVKNNVSKYEQPTKSKEIIGQYVFVALQVATDVVAKLAWLSGIELLGAVAAHYRGSNTKVIVKRHPFCRSMKVQRFLEGLESSGDVIITSSSIHNVIKNASVVFTVNSGVGLEALVHGKTVITSGACDYSYASISVKTIEELHSVLAQDLKPNQQLIGELLYFYVNSFAIPSNDLRRLSQRVTQWLAN